MSLSRRLRRLEEHSSPSEGLPWRTPEEEAERARQCDALWAQLAEYGIQRPTEEVSRHEAFRRLMVEFEKHRYSTDTSER